MGKSESFVSRTPPEGLTDWAPVRDCLETWGLVYEAVWVPDTGLEFLMGEGARKRKAVEIRCSCCGETRILPWARTDKHRGGYGFLQEDERSGETALVGDGAESVCPICGAPVLVKKAAKVGNGCFVADETQAMSAAVVGMDRYLVLSGWTVRRQVYRNARAELEVIPAEAYVFDREHCRKLMGWRNSYSGKAGYFVSYYPEWHEPEKWHESWGAVQEIYGLTEELVAGSCLPNCKLDVYMESFRAEKAKYPVMYLRLYQTRRNVENLLVSGLPMVLDDLLDEVYHGFRWPEANIRGNISMALKPMTELRWNAPAPSKMLGLTREELRLGRAQCWGLFLWRLYTRTKGTGEILSCDDLQNAVALGCENVLELVGRGPVGKSLRYLLRQAEQCFGAADPDLIPEERADVTLLLDYWEACRALGRNLDDPQVRYPRDLPDAHETAMGQRRIKDSAEKEKDLAAAFRVRRRQLAKYIFEADGLKIVPAWCQRELQQEADTLHHCVWTYAGRHAEGKTAIFFIRRTVEPGKPYYTLELDEKKLRVRQNRGLRNCGKMEAVQAFEDLWLSWVRAGAKRDGRGRPVLPERKKEARSA